jgi:hypothetical protein
MGLTLSGLKLTALNYQELIPYLLFHFTDLFNLGYVYRGLDFHYLESGNLQNGKLSYLSDKIVRFQ